MKIMFGWHATLNSVNEHLLSSGQLEEQYWPNGPHGEQQTEHPVSDAVEYSVAETPVVVLDEVLGQSLAFDHLLNAGFGRLLKVVGQTETRVQINEECGRIEEFPTLLLG